MLRKLGMDLRTHSRYFWLLGPDRVGFILTFMIATSCSIADVDHDARPGFPQRLENPRGKRLRILEAVRRRQEDGKAEVLYRPARARGGPVRVLVDGEVH